MLSNMIIRMNKSWQNVAGFLLAMTPFFRNYRLPYINMNFATFWFMIIIFIAFFGRLLTITKRQTFSKPSQCAVLPVLICMTAYMLIEYYLIDIKKIGSSMTAGNLSELILYLFELWGLLFVFTDLKIRGTFKVHIVRISMAMSFIIYIQYVLYYLFRVVLSINFIIPFSGLYESSVIETTKQITMVSNGLFRPSAFFLEPSHFAAYSVIALGIVLFEWKSNKISAFLSVAIVLSTSGLGIAATLLLWGIKACQSLSSSNRKKIINALLSCLAALLAIIVLYFTVDFVHQAVNRVLINDDQNAISGRLWTSLFVERLSGNNVYWGVGFRNRPISDYTGSAYYMTGIVEMIYCQGWLGTAILGLTMAIAIYKMWRYGNLLNFSVMGIFVAWFVFGNIVTPYYLVKYLAFTFYEETSYLSRRTDKIQAEKNK